MCRPVLALVVALCAVACEGAPPRAAAAPGPAAEVALPDGAQLAEDVAARYPTFQEYWYRGSAELNRYALSQSRYGEAHEGEAVLIYVTEDFLPGPQVKYDGLGPKGDALSVLKLNAYRRFYTGIYPYTIMTSSYTPAREGLALKLTSTVQEWCGQAFAQLNRRNGQLRARSFSYFQGEGDQDEALPDVPTEDALFARARRDPAGLPVGAMRLIPGLHFLRMAHRPFAPQPATASLEQGKAQWVYRLRYASGRELDLQIEASFPHRVTAWSERGRGPETRAKLTRSLHTPYWQHHRVSDAKFRDALGLQY